MKIMTGEWHDKPVDVIIHPRDGQQYIFIFDEWHRGDVMRKIARFACHPDLDFTWEDAAAVSKAVIAAANK